MECSAVRVLCPASHRIPGITFHFQAGGNGGRAQRSLTGKDSEAGRLRFVARCLPSGGGHFSCLPARPEKETKQQTSS